MMSWAAQTHLAGRVFETPVLERDSELSVCVCALMKK